MILYTVQSVGFVYNLLNNGVIHTDPNLIDKEFISSYNWLNPYLEKKSPKPANVEYPIWAWYRNNWTASHPNYRNPLNRYQEPEYLLKIDIPENDVLLSDYELWHYVLNDWYLPSHYTEAECDKERAKYYSIEDESEKRRSLEKSWEEIFRVDEAIDNDYFRRGMDIQAVFWELHTENVLEYQYIKPRNRSITEIVDDYIDKGF